MSMFVCPCGKQGNNTILKPGTNLILGYRCDDHKELKGQESFKITVDVHLSPLELQKLDERRGEQTLEDYMISLLWKEVQK